jgi:hypothetical protein
MSLKLFKLFFHILANLQKVKMRKEAKIKNKIFSNEM